MKILVTGGAGYIGSVLVGILLDVGHEVSVLDNFMYGQGTALAGYCHDPNFRIVRGDCRRPADLRAAGLSTAEIIVPLAAIVGAPACDRNPPEAGSINVSAIQVLLFGTNDQQLVIYPNTNSGYGSSAPGQICTESSPISPISDYGIQKAQAEREVILSGHGISLRLATVFGMSPRMRLDLLVNDFVYRAVNDRFVILFEPRFKRNYIHVRDVANAIMHCIQHRRDMVGNVYNVGLSSANLSKLELCQVIQKHVPGFTFVEAPIGKDPDQRDYIVSNAKIEAAGWHPAWSLDDGIEELIKGYTMLKRWEFSNA